MPEKPDRVDRYESLGYGLFLHWGLYAQLGRGEWVMHREEIPAGEYEELAETFTAEAFDGREIARLADDAGMRYAVLTARHHDGFSLYDTRGLTDYDAPNAAAGRDLIADFVAGCRAEGIEPLCYHTTLDWHRGSEECDADEFEAYVDYLHDSLEILCEYDLGGVWLDGDWSRDDVDWRLDERYELLRGGLDDPVIVNNTGLSARGAVSHPEIDVVTYEQATPEDVPDDPSIAAETCQTMNRHWGIGDRDLAYASPADVIETLATCRGAGANYLLNVGPTAEGAIPAYEAATLRRAGEWVGMHEDVLFEGRPVECDAPGRDVVLETDDGRYYLAFDLASGGSEDVAVGTGGTGPRAVEGPDIGGARWLDTDEELAVASGEGLAAIDCTGYPYGSNLVVRVAEISP